MYEILLKQFKDKKIDIVDLSTAVKRGYITETQMKSIITIVKAGA